MNDKTVEMIAIMPRIGIQKTHYKQLKAELIELSIRAAWNTPLSLKDAQKALVAAAKALEL